MASRSSKPNRRGGGGRHSSNSNSRQFSLPHNQQPNWRERNTTSSYEDNRTHSNNINSNTRGFMLSNTATEYYSYQHHYNQQQLLHYAHPQDFYYYPSYAPLQVLPPPVAATHFYNSNSTVQTSAPVPSLHRPPSSQPQNITIQSRKSLGKVFNSEGQNARAAAEVSESLVSLMEKVEVTLEPSTSLMNNSPRDVPTFPKHLLSEVDKNLPGIPLPLVAIRRPDQGGKEGPPICLLANHFLVEFEPSQQIFHYDMEISPPPSKEVARHLKRKLVAENAALLSNALPAFDGRKNLYSAVEFQKEKMEFFVSLPMRTARGISTCEPNIHLSLASGCEAGGSSNREKLFKVSIKIASKLNGKELNEFLKNKEDHAALPQDFIQALDVVLRENPTEKCFPVSRSLYSSSMGSEVIGGGAVGLRGFFQSLRATQQGLALNVDFSVTAFHESIGIIPYLQKRCEFLHDLPLRKSRMLSPEEKNEVEKALKNMRIFVCHRATDQRYKVHSLTDGVTDVLTFKERDGKVIRVVDYFKEHYNHEIEYINLPCLQISRSKPCYLPMELCIICEGQKFLGKLSDDQTAKILRMGCQKPRERKAIIKGVLGGAVGPRSGNYAKEFKIFISQEMTKLNGRILHPPKLRLGDGGHIRDLTPVRQDRQWNLLESHVVEGRDIKRWGLISFGGNAEQRRNVGKFISELAQRCNQLGISLSRSTVVSPQFELMQTLDNVKLLETKLTKIYESASSKLDLLVCVMERKHKGYADLKRICETSIGVVTQCCLYSHLNKLSSQYLANLALKINAKVGGSTVALYNPLPKQLPRLFSKPAIFLGADVTHPHPLDDKSPSIAAVVASMNWPAANKYVARMRSQGHRKEIIEGLKEMVGELLEDYREEVKQLPARIVFFRDGVSEGQFYKVLDDELRALKAACQRFENYDPTITFAVVQKRHHTRLFPSDGQATTPGNSLSGVRVHRTVNRNTSHGGKQFSSSSDAFENIPPGTVVDTLITHPREFDFYLCSHSGIKGTSRPTHYHVLWDENNFLSDELQTLINNLCYTFVRCTKPVSLVPPAYYAHLAAYRAHLYLDKSSGISKTSCRRSTCSSDSSNISVHCGPYPLIEPPPFPKLNEYVKKLLFYC
ncbi:hypothetical protein SUGI_0206690 [Cryptomeria japonica]|nr:hypothetical protein SUGI_0206690 [Cryptomeria japonica]